MKRAKRVKKMKKRKPLDGVHIFLNRLNTG